MASAVSFADDIADRDADLGDIGDAPAGFPQRSDRPLALVDAFAFDRLARPAVKAENAIGFGYRVPALDIRYGAPALRALFDVRRRKIGSKVFDLFGRETHR